MTTRCDVRPPADWIDMPRRLSEREQQANAAMTPLAAALGQYSAAYHWYRLQVVQGSAEWEAQLVIEFGTYLRQCGATAQQIHDVHQEVTHLIAQGGVPDCAAKYRSFGGWLDGRSYD